MDSRLMNLQHRSDQRMKFDSKVVIVTGGASGIGEAAVRLFAKEGAKVVTRAKRFPTN
jgi:NAD(P)-dependent dehydrogenase (short-subunit alcohol dehydrogenase family)